MEDGWVWRIRDPIRDIGQAPCLVSGGREAIRMGSKERSERKNTCLVQFHRRLEIEESAAALLSREEGL